jgi:hypothetical protein
MHAKYEDEKKRHCTFIISNRSPKPIHTMPTKPKPDAAEKGGKKNAPKNEAKGGKKDDKKGA